MRLNLLVMFISKSKLVRVLVVGSIVLLVNVTSLYATNASLSSGNIVEIEKGNVVHRQSSDE